jgi:hypothetical protein
MTEPELSGEGAFGRPAADRASSEGAGSRYGEDAYWRHVRQEADKLFVRGPSDDEVDAWADRERERRREWADGPTEHEKLLWARQERIRRARAAGASAPGGSATRSADDGDERLRRARRFRRDARRLALGSFATLLDLPFLTASSLVSVGRDVERGVDGPSSRRVPFGDDALFVDDDGP